MIPKIIHYCWFGGKEKPQDVLSCIESWKKFLPDYEIKEWNESNYDINKCQYMADAYKEKKWAFVSDYCRIDVVNQYGGLYLDTDVEVIKSFDPLLKEQFFCGYEASEPKASPKAINFGLAFGSEASSVVLSEILEEYHKLSFYKPDGNFNLITCPTLQTKVLERHGVTPNGENQKVNGITVFSEEYFCPMNYLTGKTNITPNTYSIHHYSATWMPWYYSAEQRFWHFFGIKNLKILLRIHNLFKYGTIRSWV